MRVSVLEKIKSGFLQYGWLAPAFLPLTMFGGRGLFHTVFFIYLLWALISAKSLRIRNQSLLLSLYGLLLCAYALSIPFAIDVPRALKMWSTLLAFNASAFITLAMVQLDSNNVRRLLGVLGLLGAVTLGVAYLDLLMILWLEDAFIPRLQLKSVHLIIYMPFLLAWLWWRKPESVRRAATMLIAFLLLSAYIILSEERSSVISMVVGMVFLGIVALRMPLYRVLILMALLISIAFFSNGEHLLRGVSLGGDFLRHLDTISSGRLTLWRQALEHSPENPLLGVGMGNSRYYMDTVSINGHVVKHLHNIWLDTWFDTGLPGLAMLITVIGYVFLQLSLKWRKMGPVQRFHAGVFLAGAVTLLTQAQFSISYASREIGIYFFMYLLILSHLSHMDSRGYGDARY